MKQAVKGSLVGIYDRWVLVLSPADGTNELAYDPFSADPTQILAWVMPVAPGLKSLTPSYDGTFALAAHANSLERWNLKLPL